MEPALPIDRMEPADPNDSTDPAEATDSIEPIEPNDRIERGDAMDRIECRGDDIVGLIGQWRSSSCAAASSRLSTEARTSASADPS